MTVLLLDVLVHLTPVVVVVVIELFFYLSVPESHARVTSGPETEAAIEFSHDKL